MRMQNHQKIRIRELDLLSNNYRNLKISIMGIERIDLRESINYKPYKLNESIVCVSDLFLRFLNDKNLTRRYAINIYLIPSAMKPDVSINSGIIDLHIHFDFDVYKSIIANSQKREYLTNFILNGMIIISEFMDWSIDIFTEAFEKCRLNNYINEFYFNNKLYESPNKTYYFGLFMNYDIDKFQIFEHLFDSNKILICERLCFFDRFKSFSIEKIEWNPESNRVHYKYRGPNKIFEARIDDLLLCRQIDLPKTTSKYFI